MADPVIINPSLTLAGQAAAFNADEAGIELKITHVSFGRAHYDPSGNELALVDPVGSKIPVAGGSRPTPYQLRITSAWREDVGTVPVGEIGWWAGNVLVFVWSKANGQVAVYKTDGTPYVMFNDLAFTQVPGGSISFTIDPLESVALAALTEHEGSPDAHPQYMLRADMAYDSGPLAYLSTTSSTANVLILKFDTLETDLPSLRAGQRFQFLAPLANTGPVTAKVEDFATIAVKRGGDTGLVDLEAGDIKAGSLYDLNYDGTFFQLGGGVGSGKAFERYSFTAGVAQAVFTFPHVPGSLIALRNGREIYDFTSSANGSQVTTAPMNVDDRLEFLAFKSFKVADSYTKAEMTALLATAGGLPVGAMLPFPRGIVPAGYLEVNGTSFNPAIYPDLAAYLGGSTLPESRAEFLRGWDHGRGVDIGREVGTTQGDMTKAHSHGMAVDSGSGAGFGSLGVKSSAGGLLGGVTRSMTTNTDSSVGTETRPRNLSVMWCIKAWNAPVNQGQIDVAALVAELEKLKSGVPVGAMVPFPVGIVPAGYLEVDNTLFLDVVFPDLAAFLAKKFNLPGDPVGSTRLPESRGEFLRGWDHGRGVDSGRTLGSYQIGSYLPGDNNAHDECVYVHNSSNKSGLGWDVFTGTPAAGALRYGTVSSSAADPIPLTDHGGAARPRNLSVMWCIKAWTTPINQGTLNVAALAEQVTQLSTTLANLFKTVTDVKASRAIGVTYTNATGQPIFVNVALVSTSTNQTATLIVDGKSIYGSSYPATGSSLAVSAVVPPGSTYIVPAAGYTLANWTEVR